MKCASYLAAAVLVTYHTFKQAAVSFWHQLSSAETCNSIYELSTSSICKKHCILFNEFKAFRKWRRGNMPFICTSSNHRAPCTHWKQCKASSMNDQCTTAGTSVHIGCCHQRETAASVIYSKWCSKLILPLQMDFWAHLSFRIYGLASEIYRRFQQWNFSAACLSSSIRLSSKVKGEQGLAMSYV